MLHETKKHIGWVNAYHINDDYCYTDGDGKLTIGINIPDLNSRRRGYATEAWSLSKALISVSYTHLDVYKRQL